MKKKKESMLLYKIIACAITIIIFYSLAQKTVEAKPKKKTVDSAKVTKESETKLKPIHKKKKIEALTKPEQTFLTDSLQQQLDSLEVAKPLAKPHPFPPISNVIKTPTEGLDNFLRHMKLSAKPYLPPMQEISIGLESMYLIKNVWNLKTKIRDSNSKYPYEYAVLLRFLLRYNLQLSLQLGYVKLFPEKLKDNHFDYSTTGLYGKLGASYLMRYNDYNSCYIGWQYAHTVFEHAKLINEPITMKKKMQAYWFEVVIGTETRFFDRIPLYGGFEFWGGRLIHFDAFLPAANYMIPNYGMSANTYNIGLQVYLHYKFSFLERLIRLN